ncbi:MAG: hypothetical protein QOE88_2700 [Verrucomicrobiota bacterium]|nr:hypothetical protein [Verrucomicrobiota bacterium]
MRQRWLAFGGNARQEYPEKLQELQNKNWNRIPGTMFTEESGGIAIEVTSPLRRREESIEERAGQAGPLEANRVLGKRSQEIFGKRFDI